MNALHTAYQVTLVSQATSALVFWLLAWSDRRSRGLVSFAAACTLHLLAILLLPLWRVSDHWIAEALSAAFLPTILVLTYRALALVLRRRVQAPFTSAAAVAGLAVVVIGIAPWSELWSMQIARAAAVFISAWTVRMLWQTEVPELRVPTRGMASLLLFLITLFVVRMPMEPHMPATSLVLTLRSLTMYSMTLLAFCFLVVYLAETKRRVNDETRVDALTGLLNRRAMEEQAADHIRRAQRNKRPLALLMMDLDRFKLLNDTWGHGVGDRALHAVGEVLLAGAGAQGSTVARLGGEEFAMLLPGHSVVAAFEVAERLRTQVYGLDLHEGGQSVPFTVSIGVAGFHSGEPTWKEMLYRADTALYEAKHAGRNRVEVCETASPHPSSAMRKRRLRRTPLLMHVDSEEMEAGHARDPRS